MNAIKKMLRFISINYILLKYGLDKLVWTTPLLRPLKILIIFFPWRWFHKNERPTGVAIREALEELGPIFVKFGQLLSTRQDLLPDDVAMELAKLQDKVPPFASSIAKEMIEKSLNQPIDALFKEFDLIPIASASIAQVHKATLFNGAEVVVKVLRPNLHQQIKQDLGLLESFAKALQRVKSFKRFKPLELVYEIKSTLLDEIDLLKEAANASQLKRNFSTQDILYVPEVYWDYCRKNVLVIERIEGVRISDINTLNAHHVNLKRLAERGVEIFFTQVFRDCFFHADMHPGNIFADIKTPDNPRYIAVDFGIMGTLDPIDQRYLAENFLAFFERDYRRVASLHIESGWVPKHTSIGAFESAIRTVCEPIFEKPLKNISFAQTLLRLFQVARKFDMEVQPQLLLLQKTLVSVEGLGRQLYPDLDLWTTAKPFLETWLRNHYSPKKMLRTIKQKIPKWANEAVEIPDTLHDVLQYWQSHVRPYLQQQTSSKATKANTLSTRSVAYIGMGCTLLIVATIIGLETLPEVFLTQWGLPLAGVIALIGVVCLRKKTR